MRILLAMMVFVSVEAETVIGEAVPTPASPDSTTTSEVAKAEGGEIIDFKNDLIPMFTKLGCNAGKCHGSAIGRGEFKLSLYGGTPEADYEQIVRHFGGRRVNLTSPESSLILQKPTESLEHGGGMVLEADDKQAQMLLEWIKQGAKYVEHRKLDYVEVSPSRFVATKVGEIVPLKAVAHYDDGLTRIVTDQTQFLADDSTAVMIDSESRTAKVTRPGRHIVIARYSTEVIPVEFVVPLSDSTVQNSSKPSVNFVDREIFSSLGELRLPTSPPINDATFIRRITLDLTGRLPEYTSKVQDANAPDSVNREAIIDQLLDSEQFVQFYAFKLAKLLRIRSKIDKNRVNTKPEAARKFHQWLEDQLRDGVGYDRMATEILTASGDSSLHGPATFYTLVEDARLQTEFVAEVFMGSRIKCANCHNHPLDKWTQDDFHGMTAIFAKLTRSQIIQVNPFGKNIHPNTGEAAVMKIPGGNFLPEATEDGRKDFAQWLIEKDNPFFAKAMVNRLWKSMMGRGLVEPVDDFRPTNPASHPHLLNLLADDFVQHHYDIRHTLKVIAMSAAYARSSNPKFGNDADNRFYSHAIIQPLEPEVLADAISDVLGVDGRYGEEAAGTRAVQLRDGSIPSDALDILGRCDRANSCEGAPSPTGPLTQKLHLFNGELLNSRIGANGGRLASLIKDQKTPMEIVQEFYHVALYREPNLQETRFLSKLFDDNKPSQQQRAKLEDFVWSILTCQEFVNKH